MPKTDDTRILNGKRYRYFGWVKHRSTANALKKRAKLNGVLMRVVPTKDGYTIWTRGPTRRL